MKPSLVKMIFFLGLAGVILGIARYAHQETIISNVIKQFQHGPLSSMKFFVFIDEKNDHPDVLLKSIEKFLGEANTLSNSKKISLSVIYSNHTPGEIKNKIEELQQKYPAIYQVESANSLLNQEKKLKLPQVITANPNEELSQKLLKLLLLGSNEQAVFITSAAMFPASYQPTVGKNHLNHALQKTQYFNDGVIFCQVYPAPAIVGSKEIFFIDQQVLLRCLPSVQLKILQGLALQRINSAASIFEHVFHTKNECLSVEEYDQSIKSCITSYNQNPSLLLGAPALQNWAIGNIFYDQMAIEYKGVGIFQQLGPWTGSSEEKLIAKGCWSADVAKRFLQTKDISALIATIIIAQDYELAVQQQLTPSKAQSMLTLYQNYRQQLSNDELFILHDICPNSSAEMIYSSKISA